MVVNDWHGNDGSGTDPDYSDGRWIGIQKVVSWSCPAIDKFVYLTIGILYPFSKNLWSDRYKTHIYVEKTVSYCDIVGGIESHEFEGAWNHHDQQLTGNIHTCIRLPGTDTSEGSWTVEIISYIQSWLVEVLRVWESSTVRCAQSYFPVHLSSQRYCI